jgi:hypothetical protein
MTEEREREIPVPVPTPRRKSKPPGRSGLKGREVVRLILLQNKTSQTLTLGVRSDLGQTDPLRLAPHARSGVLRLDRLTEYTLGFVRRGQVHIHPLN